MRPAATDRDATRLVADVREIIETNHYMTLATVDTNCHPRASPVYYTHRAYEHFYWVSSPDAQHSKNIAARPRIEVVIFDSTRQPAQTQAVYLGGTARLTESDIDRAQAFHNLGPGARAFSREELSGTAPLRLYCFRAETYELHIRGGDPRYGHGVDTRLAVPSPPAASSSNPV